MNIGDNLNRFYEDLNQAVNEYVEENKGKIPEKMYVHTKKNGGYEINAKSQGGAAIDRKLAKFARAHLRNSTEVSSQNLKDFYMKRSLIKKIISWNDTSSKLIRQIDQFKPVKPQNNIDCSRGLEKPICDSGLIKVDFNDYYTTRYLANNMNALFNENPNIYNDLKESKDKESFIETLDLIVSTIVGPSPYNLSRPYKFMKIQNSRIFNHRAHELYDKIQQDVETLEESEEFDINNLPESINSLLKCLEDASLYYKGVLESDND